MLVSQTDAAKLTHHEREEASRSDSEMNFHEKRQPGRKIAAEQPQLFCPQTTPQAPGSYLQDWLLIHYMIINAPA